MTNHNDERLKTSAPSAPRRPWEAPEVITLPKLTELTLQTFGGGIPGGGDLGSGSTVIP